MHFIFFNLKSSNLNLSFQDVVVVPDSIKHCKYLETFDASVNPLGK